MTLGLLLLLALVAPVTASAQTLINGAGDLSTNPTARGENP
jgi:hypothetical protein